MKIKIYIVLLFIFLLFITFIFKICFEIEKEKNTTGFIENTENEKIIDLEKKILITMQNEIIKCNNDYFLGIYKINENMKNFQTLEIYRSYKNETYSILNFNPFFTTPHEFDDMTFLILNYVKSKVVFYPKSIDIPIVDLFIKNSYSQIKDVALVLVKDKDKKPRYGFSFSVIEYTSCTKKDITKILQTLAIELENKL
jgi:hypothetical protein